MSVESNDGRAFRQRMARRLLKFFAIATLAIAVAYAVLWPAPESDDALLIATSGQGARREASEVREDCGAALNRTSPKDDLQLWLGTPRTIDKCLNDMASTQTALVAAPWVNWLCRPDAPPERRLFWAPRLRDEAPLRCSDPRAQFTYLTGIALSDAQLAPPTAAAIPLLEEHARIKLIDPTIQRTTEATVRRIEVIENGGYQLWFDLDTGGDSGYVTIRENVKAGQLKIGGIYFVLAPLDPVNTAAGGYTWQQFSVDRDSPTHPSNAEAGVDRDTLTEQRHDAASDPAQARALLNAQAPYRNFLGDAVRDKDGLHYQLTCPADPPATAPKARQVPLRILFAYTQAARSGMAAKQSDSTARESIRAEIDGVLVNVNAVLKEQHIAIQMITADITPIPGIDPVLDLIDASFAKPPGVRGPDMHLLKWVDILVEDILSLQSVCLPLNDSCATDNVVLKPQQGVSDALRRQALAAIEPVLVGERLKSRADIVAFVVGEKQMEGHGLAAGIRASYFNSFFFIRVNSLRANLTLQHEIGHLLGGRHELLSSCPSELCSLDPACRGPKDSSCPSECLLDAIDNCEGAPKSNHAHTFEATLVSKTAGPGDIKLRVGTIMSTYDTMDCESLFECRMNRWSERLGSKASTWPASPYLAPKPLHLSFPANGATPGASNEARVISAYAVCASQFLPSRLDPLPSIQSSGATTPTLGGIFDASLGSNTALADRDAHAKEVRDPQRTISFDTDSPTARNPQLFEEQGWEVDEVLYALGPDDEGQMSSSTRRAFYVEGYADRVGNERHNCQLAWRRANAVAARICAQAPHASIGVTGYGEQWPAVLTEDERPEGRNRRVVISWPDIPLTRVGSPIRTESCQSFLQQKENREKTCEMQ